MKEKKSELKKRVGDFSGRFSKSVNMIFDIVTISILHVILCVPIITFGGAKTAMYKVCVRWMAGEDASVVDYIREFRKERRSGIVPGLLTVFAAAFLIADVLVCRLETCPFAMRVITAGMILVVSGIVEQMYQLNARFQVTVKDLIKDACIVSFVHPIRSLISAAFGLLIWIPALNMYLISLVNKKVYAQMEQETAERADKE